MKDYNHTSGKQHILLLDQSRQSLPFLKALKKAGHSVTIVCNSVLSEGYFSIYPNKRLLWPSYIKDKNKFEEKLLDYISTHKIDIVIAVGDVSADIVARNRDEILKYSKVTVPRLEVFSLAADKGNTMMFCMENNIPCPKTFLFDQGNKREIVHQIQYPVIVKPRRGNGAIGVIKFNNADEVLNHFDRMHQSFGDLIIQEYIPHHECAQFCAEAFLDNESNLKICVVVSKPRYYPIAGGTGTTYITVDRPDIVSTTKNLLEKMKWIGAADVDLIVDTRDNIAKVVEINPRVAACIKVAFSAGINFADNHVRLANHLPIQNVKHYKLGVYLRNFVMETLWFISATKEMKANSFPKFFTFKNVVEETFSWSDPFTMLGYILGLLRKYSDMEKLKKKLHR